MVFLCLPPLTNGFGSRHWKGRRKKASKYWRSLGVTSRQCADIDETGLNVCVSVRAWGATFNINNVIWSENKLRLSIYRIFLVIHWKNAFRMNDARLNSDPFVLSTSGFWKLQTSRLFTYLNISVSNGDSNYIDSLFIWYILFPHLKAVPKLMQVWVKVSDGVRNVCHLNDKVYLIDPPPMATFIHAFAK